MSFLSNAHTHTPYCDGLSTIAEMIEAARRLGFVSLGFSGHGDQGFGAPYSMLNGNQEKYLSELRALQQSTRAPRLWVGVEEDALTPPEKKARNRATMDYVIGSTHFVGEEFEGQHVGVDGDPDVLRRYIRQALDGDALEMVRRYYRGHVAHLLRDKPDIIGHFDLVRKYAKRLSVFDEDGAAYRRIALNALEEAFSCGAVLEVNTGGMARGYISTPNPTGELLGAWREMGGRVTITSDCHDARYLDFAFDKVERLLMSLGYTSAWRLGAGNELWEEVRLRATISR